MVLEIPGLHIDVSVKAGHFEVMSSGLSGSSSVAVADASVHCAGMLARDHLSEWRRVTVDETREVAVLAGGYVVLQVDAYAYEWFGVCRLSPLRSEGLSSLGTCNQCQITELEVAVALVVWQIGRPGGSLM